MDTSNQKKVSIILPCHNESQWLDECVESLIAQTYSNLEIVIVDDGSVDNSFEVMKLIQKKYGDTLIKTFQFITNQGEGRARNKGAQIASGYYIIQTDADALFPQNFVSLSIRYIEENKVDSLSLGELRIHPKRKGLLAQYWKLKRKTTFLLREKNMREEVMSIFCYPKNIWEKLNGYDETIPHSTDFDFGMRARKLGFSNIWAKDVFFEHADPTDWKIFFKRLYNGSRFSVPIQKKWNRWLTKKQQVKELSQTIATVFLIVLGFLGITNIYFFPAWILLFLGFGILPLFIHKESRLIFTLAIKNKYLKLIAVLPFITILRTWASNFGKTYAILFYKKVQKTITFDV